MAAGLSKHTLVSVEGVLKRHAQVSGQGLSVSDLHRETNIARASIYKALEHLGAVRDDTFYPPTYLLPTDDKRRDVLIDILEKDSISPARTSEELADRILAVI